MKKYIYIYLKIWKLLLQYDLKQNYCQIKKNTVLIHHRYYLSPFMEMASDASHNHKLSASLPKDVGCPYITVFAVFVNNASVGSNYVKHLLVTSSLWEQTRQNYRANKGSGIIHVKRLKLYIWWFQIIVHMLFCTFISHFQITCPHPGMVWTVASLFWIQVLVWKTISEKIQVRIDKINQ